MTCPGLHYRASIEHYPGHRGFSARFRLRLLKSESCPGCPDCAEIARRVSLLGKGAWVDNIGECRHGRKYRLKLLPGGQND